MTLTDDAATPALAGGPKEDGRLEPTRAFIAEVAKLDNGELAALRRNAGMPLAQARGVARFYSLLNRFSVPERDEDIYFLVATLAAYDKELIDGRPGPAENLGRTLHRLAGTGSADGAETRLKLLLDASPREGGAMPFRLRQVVRLLLSKGLRPSWARLLVDLRDWDRPDRRAQKAWARAYYDADRDAQSANAKGA